MEQRGRSYQRTPYGLSDGQRTIPLRYPRTKEEKRQLLEQGLDLGKINPGNWDRFFGNLIGYTHSDIDGNWLGVLHGTIDAPREMPIPDSIFNWQMRGMLPIVVRDGNRHIVLEPVIEDCSVPAGAVPLSYRIEEVDPLSVDPEDGTPDQAVEAMTEPVDEEPKLTIHQQIIQIARGEVVEFDRGQTQVHGNKVVYQVERGSKKFFWVEGKEVEGDPKYGISLRIFSEEKWPYAIAWASNEISAQVAACHSVNGKAIYHRGDWLGRAEEVMANS